MAARTLYIVRGLPSSGKTTLAEAIAPEWNTGFDDPRIRAAEVPPYSGDGFLILLNRSKALVDTWMRAGNTPIAIANVNATRGDVSEWVMLAASRGYDWSVIHVETDLSDYELAARSRTQCPASAIALFRARWQPWGS